MKDDITYQKLRIAPVGTGLSIGTVRSLMRLVSDGEQYCVLQRSNGEVCRVRELCNGTIITRPCSDLTPVSPDEFVEARDVDIDISGPRERSERAIALATEFAVAGPTSARVLLDRFDACESDIHGATTELRAAGLIKPTTVHGERGYRATERVSDALAP